LEYLCGVNTDDFHFAATIEISGNKLWGAHFTVPDWVAKPLTGDNNRRVVCILNEKTRYQCALLPKGDGSFLIMVNKKNRDQLGLKPGSRVQVSLRRDDSEYGLPMPEEFAELLAQDEEGSRLFHALTPGKLRTLLYIVGQPKNSDNRLARALAVVEHLKSNGGKIDYKKLYADLKDASARL
jgi:hypothetical protein